jgi:CheY-like chemotaxis protein
MLDINLPDGSGIELGHRLKADGYSIPVIYMTGNDKPAIRDATLASGCIAFLTKPFSVDDLIGPLGKGIPVKLIYTLYRPAFPKGRGLILH